MLLLNGGIWPALVILYCYSCRLLRKRLKPQILQKRQFKVQEANEVVVWTDYFI